MLCKRTDLAIEAKELWQEQAEETTKLEGVEAVEEIVEGFTVERVRVINEAGEQNIGKPIGSYVTVNLEVIARREDGAFSRGAAVICNELRNLIALHKDESVLVAGLGNRAITPDNLGPKTVAHTMVTRHLVERIPEHFALLRRVSVVEAGVLGTTGIESAELIKAISAEIKPDALIVIDALASRKLSRVCRTVQLTDTGIVPGSGVGNSRTGLNSDSIGIPVIAIGVPTVVDAGTLAADLLERTGIAEVSPEVFGSIGADMIVTPKEIDAYMNDISKLLGYAINLALHEGLSEEDITMFIS